MNLARVKLWYKVEAMKLLTDGQARRIYDVTDALGFNRQWIVLPLGRSSKAVEQMLPDGKIFISVPEAAAFETWFSGLSARLAALKSDRTPRTDWTEPAKAVLLADSPPGSEGPPFLYTQSVKPKP